MNESWKLVETVGTGLAVGVLLGASFLAGLHRTVTRLRKSPHPGRLLLLSATLRVGVVVAAVTALAAHEPLAAAAALLGFAATRVLVVAGTAQAPRR